MSMLSMLSFLVYFVEDFSVNLKMVYIAHGTDTESQCDAVDIPQRMQYQKPLLMTGNVCLEPHAVQMVGVMSFRE